MPTWDEAADWYAQMATDPALGYNALAVSVAVSLLGDVRGREVLDLGCGEGQAARRLARAGATVTGIDPTARLIELAEAAEAREPLGIRYSVGRAECLDGLPDASTDAVCAVLVLHHTDPLEAAVAEVRRVLRPGGVLAAVIPHPAFDHPDAGWFEGGRYLGRYAEERHWSTTDGGPVRAVHHIGWHHRTLATWLTALGGAGLRIERAAEPMGRDAGRPDGGGPWRDIPRFLALRCTA
ncbi:MAG TPA: class I SAM-dependent methyltransferase [Dactylosporangium sp.]|jgi:SAM-dependent methyltransferase|nr:class I SAM-dependent methyltransferase [Dactylosporangium sp.]